MYPVRLGYDVAIKRINSLIENKHYAEAFVTSVFTVEKTLRRTLRQLVISAGFKSKIADIIIKNINGLQNLTRSWEVYDPNHRKLRQIINQDDLNIINEAGTKRNKLVHGNSVFKVEVYKEETKKILAVLNRLKIALDDEYGYSGWVTAKFRKISVLHVDPKIKLN